MVAARLEEELPVDFCCIFLYDGNENQLTVTSVSARSVEAAQKLGLNKNTVVPIDENGLSRCVQGHLVYEADIAAVKFPFPQRLASVGFGRHGDRTLAGREPGVRRAGLCARGRRTASRAVTASSCANLSEHTALAAHQAQLYSRCNAPTTTCARRNNR